jgi:hypothetical protein
MTNSFKILSLFIFITSLNAACNKQQKQPVVLTAVQKITQFNDTTFFTGTSAMLFTDGHLYMAAGKGSKIYQLGSQLNIIGSMGSKGKGPGEFTGITDLKFANDSLYVYARTQAKIAVYDENNHFVRGTGIHETYGFSFAVDKQSHIYLSTAERKHPITELDAHGNRIRTFGNNTIGKDSRHVLRNERMLFIHNNKLIAVPPSEPFVAVYTLEGERIHKTKLSPPGIHDLLAWAKKENEGSAKNPALHVTGSGNSHHFVTMTPIFRDATMYENHLYLIANQVPPTTGHTYKKKYNYVFKYKVKPNGKLIFERGFKLFRPNHQQLLYGLNLGVGGKHKLLVYDISSGLLYEYKDDRL